MIRFRKLLHALWYCQYHMVWVTKNRYRVLSGVVGKEVHSITKRSPKTMTTTIQQHVSHSKRNGFVHMMVKNRGISVAISHCNHSESTV